MPTGHRTSALTTGSIAQTSSRAHRPHGPNPGSRGLLPRPRDPRSQLFPRGTSSDRDPRSRGLLPRSRHAQALAPPHPTAPRRTTSGEPFSRPHHSVKTGWSNGGAPIRGPLHHQPRHRDARGVRTIAFHRPDASRRAIAHRRLWRASANGGRGVCHGCVSASNGGRDRRRSPSCALCTTAGCLRTTARSRRRASQRTTSISNGSQPLSVEVGESHPNRRCRARIKAATTMP
jgi:hypothetical protein